MKKAKIHMYILKLILKIFLCCIIGLLFTSFIDDILILPTFITVLYILFVGGIILSGIALLVIILVIYDNIDWIYPSEERTEYKNEIYNQILHKDKNKYE